MRFEQMFSSFESQTIVLKTTIFETHFKLQIVHAKILTELLMEIYIQKDEARFWLKIGYFWQLFTSNAILI